MAKFDTLTDSMVAIKKLLRPGVKIRIQYQDDNPNNCILHVRSIVDENKVVVCWWLRRSKTWTYTIQDMILLAMQYQDGHLFFEGKSRVKTLDKLGTI